MSKVNKKQLVIVGNGMATGRLLDGILKYAPDQYDITVIGEEAQGSYNRIMLSSVLAGEVRYEDIIQKPIDWYQQQGIRLIINSRAVKVHRLTMKVELDDQRLIAYDELVIAIGSRSSQIPAKNQNIQGVYNFRNIQDTQKIQLKSKTKKRAVVIGGGLLGLEAAYGLAISGVSVTLIHRNRWLLNRQLDKVSGEMLQAILESKNITVELGSEVAVFESRIDACQQEVVSGAKLKNGKSIATDMIVVATGITPNSELGKNSGLEVNRAIVVDDYMQTSDDHISALGECCEHHELTFGLVDPIWLQCDILAKRLTVGEVHMFKNAPSPTKLKVSGVQLFSAGQVESCGDTRTYSMVDENSKVYRKLILKNNRIVGVVLFGDVSSGMDYFDLMQQKTEITSNIPLLLIGTEFVSEDSEPVSSKAEKAL